MNSAGVKINEKKDNKTGALFFISAVQANNLAQLVISGEKDAKLYKQALKETPSVDIALFGRMVADDADLNVDAASQVAHSISTHAVQNEYDYFTAVDVARLRTVRVRDISEQQNSILRRFTDMRL